LRWWRRWRYASDGRWRRFDADSDADFNVDVERVDHERKWYRGCRRQ
jgi:hypothetical protein